MPYSDFTERPWRILESSTSCGRDKIVRFRGPANEVAVLCGETPYRPGTYLPAEGKLGERVERAGEYTIMILPPNPKHHLVASFTNDAEGGGGGSWTAEDNSSGDSGG
ncbi:MAG TPA: hypothetical protein VIE43_14280 [Thermoanaerobaculia bacterium]|jgi:hypothetical protein|nr:hypothetical protein [Thermoanaerobaculia bacterium]